MRTWFVIACLLLAFGYSLPAHFLRRATTTTQTCGLQEAEAACPPTSCRIYYPAIATPCQASATFKITKSTILIGDGPGSEIIWAAGVSGITCLNNVGPDSTIQGMNIRSASKVLGADDGIWNQCHNMKILDNQIYGFGRYGINSDSSTTLKANGNQSRYEGNTIAAVRSHGIYINGHDSNAITTENNSILDTGGFGIYETTPHNVHINDEVAFAGYNFAGGLNCSAGSTDLTHGAFHESGSTNFWFNPYAEGGCNSILVENGSNWGIWIQGPYAAVAHVYGPNIGAKGGNHIWIKGKWVTAPQ